MACRRRSHADRKLAEHIDAVDKNQPLPLQPEANPAARAKAPLTSDRTQLVAQAQYRERAYSKILEGRPLKEEEEER
jgi:hypothetical protein